MRVRRTITWAVLAAIAAVGCAGSGSSQPALVWVRDDGTAAERAELIAARDACMQSVNASKTPFTRRFGHVEYAGQVIDCVKAKGYHLIDAPDE